MSGQSLLLERHEAVMSLIHAAETKANRLPSSVKLLAVSKTFSAQDVLLLSATGQRAFGENYVQEAVDKIRTCADERPDLKLEWHFIGPLQSNKTKLVADNFDWMQSVERLKIAQRLSEQRPSHKDPLKICIQVNVSNEASKSGCLPHDVVQLAMEITALPHLQLRGIMAIPEATDDLSKLASQFELARKALADIQLALPGNHQLDTLSMGMSGDLELAISHGATMVRVGSAIFGRRS